MKKYLLLLLTTSTIYGNNNFITISAPKTDITDNLIFEEDNENSKNNTLDEKLKNDVSYFLVNDNHNKNSISFRGIKSTATNIIEDLIPSFKTTNGNIDFYFNHDMYDISSNMLITPSSLGVSSMGSDIELLTKEPFSLFEGNINTTISQNDNEQKLYFGSQHNKFFYQLNLNRYDRSSYKLSNSFSPTTEQPNYKRVNSDKNLKSLEFKGGYRFNDKDSFKIKYKTINSHMGVEPNIYDGTVWNAYSRINRKDLQSLYGYYDHINSDYSSHLRLYYDNYKDIYDIYTDKTYSTLSFPSSLYDDTRVGAVIKSTFKNNQDELSFVLKYQEDQHLWKRDGSIYIPEFKYRSIDGSIIGEKIYKNLTINSAVTYKKFEPVKVDYDGDPTYSQSNSGTSNDTLDYQVGIDYLLDSNLWYLSHSKTTRTPSMSEMYAFFPWSVINNDLKVENSTNFEIGYKKFSNTGLYSLSLYNYDIKNKIITVNNQAKNLEKARHQGVEFRYENNYFENHHLKFSYIYSKAEDGNGQKLELIPSNKVILEDKINLDKNFSGNIQYIYLSKRVDDTVNGRKNLNSHSLVNIYLNTKLSSHIEATFGVKNLFNKYYESAYGYTGEGRNIYALISWEF